MFTQMTSPEVSILVPSFNQKHLLPIALESVVEQTLKSIEIIVGDDSSTDGTDELLKTLASRHPTLRFFINSVNLGRVRNYRKLLNSAKGEFVMILDADDYLLDPSWVEVALDLAKKKNLGIVFGKFSILFESTGKSFAPHPNMSQKKIFRGRDLFLRYPQNGIALTHVGALFRRQQALDLDFYRKDIPMSDFESLFRLLLRVDVGFLPITVFVYRKHGANITSQFDPVEWIKRELWINSVAQDAFLLLGQSVAEKWRRQSRYRLLIGGLGIFCVLGNIPALKLVKDWASDRGMRIGAVTALKLFVLYLMSHSKLLLRLLRRFSRQPALLYDLELRRFP